MNDNKKTVEERMKAIENFYFKIGDILDMLPETVPQNIKDKLKNLIVDDKELKHLMQGMEECRPPRFLLIGRTGVGKSSLINAICGMYVAVTSDVEIGTRGVERCEVKEGDRVLLEILDSRGIGESVTAEKDNSAEDVLCRQICEFKPDAILFVSGCDSRDRIDEDIKYVKKIRRKYEQSTDVKIPVILVLNRADAIEPSQFKNPKEYPHRKLDNIKSKEDSMRGLLNDCKLDVTKIISVSSLIDWGKSSEEIAEMSQSEREKMNMESDYRYNISELIDCLDENMDVDASMGLMMAANLQGMEERIARKLVKIFAGIASVITATPIPVADIAVLSALQVTMVAVIAYMTGEELDLKAAQKFITSVLGVGLGANIFKLTAKQLCKWIPIAGELINGTVAYSGTKSLGELAIQYYVHDMSMSKLKKKAENMRND